MARRNPNSPTNKEQIVLTEDQQQAIANLKSERAIYEEQLKQARRKRNKIKDIIDNFESVILGDVLLDILKEITVSLSDASAFLKNVPDAEGFQNTGVRAAGSEFEAIVIKIENKLESLISKKNFTQ